MNKFDSFVNRLNRKIKVDKNMLLFLCIGTNEIVGDSIGPIIGTYLKRNINDKFVLGDTKNNIINKYDLVNYYPKMKDKYIIAIDSAISSNKLSGEIFISNKPLVMGLGVNKNKGIVGDLSIKVAISDLENIHQSYINNLAQFIAMGITKVVSFK